MNSVSAVSSSLLLLLTQGNVCYFKSSQVKSSLLPNDTNGLALILVIVAHTGRYKTAQNKGDNKSDWTYTKYITLKLDTCVVTSVNMQHKVLVHMRRRTTGGGHSFVNFFFQPLL